MTEFRSRRPILRCPPSSCNTPRLSRLPTASLTRVFTARGLIVFLRRPGSQAQFSVSLSTQASGRKALHDLQVWMAENLNNDLSVDALARRAAMSPRNFSRVFRKETGITPAKFAERLRVEAARRQLEQTVRGIKEIAASCGFSSSEIMRRTFLSQLQITPSAYRLLFQRRSPSRTSC
jgi:transcriptional regulator GlxA family with amidase domain